MGPPPFTLCLAAGVALLGWHAAEQLEHLPAANTAISAGTSTKSAETGGASRNDDAPPSFRPHDPSLKAAALTRPLFSETRQPYEPQVLAEEIPIEPVLEPQYEVSVEEVVEETPPPRLPVFVLSGVMTDSDHKSALLSVDGATPEWRGEGDGGEHWRIETVYADKVIIKGQSVELIVELYPSQ